MTGLNLFHVFRYLPQATAIVHRFCTARPWFFIAANSRILESAITAGVNDALPVIAQGWFCGSFPEGELPSGSQSVQASRAPGRCGLLRTVSHGGIATSGRDWMQMHFRVLTAPP